MCLKRVFLGTSCLKAVTAVAVTCVKFKFPFVSAVTQYFLSFWTSSVLFSALFQQPFILDFQVLLP